MSQEPITGNHFLEMVEIRSTSFSANRNPNVTPHEIIAHDTNASIVVG